MEAKEVVMTREGYNKLVAELEMLKTVKREAIKEKIKVARSYGDLSENAEYSSAKEEQSQNEGRITDVEAMIRNAKVIEADDLPHDHVSVGTVVRIMPVGGSEADAIEYTITGSAEANVDENKISDASPVGSALVGKKPGEVAEVHLPNNRVLTFKVLSIRRAG